MDNYGIDEQSVRGGLSQLSSNLPKSERPSRMHFHPDTDSDTLTNTVADTDNDRVQLWKFNEGTTTYSHVRNIGAYGSAAGAFRKPVGVAFVPRMFSEAGVVDAVLGLFLSCAMTSPTVGARTLSSAWAALRWAAPCVRGRQVGTGRHKDS